jgi:hypothetical protein
MSAISKPFRLPPTSTQSHRVTSKSMPETGDVCVAELRNPSFGLVHRNASEIRKRPLRAPRPALESWGAARSVKIARTLASGRPRVPMDCAVECARDPQCRERRCDWDLTARRSNALVRCVSGPKLVLDRGDPFAVKCDQPARVGVAEAQVLRAVGPAVALAGTSPRCPILVRRREALTYSLGPGIARHSWCSAPAHSPQAHQRALVGSGEIRSLCDAAFVTGVTLSVRSCRSPAGTPARSRRR